MTVRISRRVIPVLMPMALSHLTDVLKEQRVGPGRISARRSISDSEVTPVSRQKKPSGTDETPDENLDDDAERRIAALIGEINVAVAEYGPFLPSPTGVSGHLSVQPPFPPDPELISLTDEEAVLHVIREFRPGEVILVGRKRVGPKEGTKPFTALALSKSIAVTARHLTVVFEAIVEQGHIPFWKLNPYSRAAVESYASVEISEKWNGKALATKSGTWSDEHISRIAFLSGDHDVGRDEQSAKTWENAIPFDDALEQYWWKILTLAAGLMPTLLQLSGRGFSPIWQLDPPVEYSEPQQRVVQAILGMLMERVEGLAVDVGIYKTVNPFIKAPGAVHPVTGRAIQSTTRSCTASTTSSRTSKPTSRGGSALPQELIRTTR